MLSWWPKTGVDHGQRGSGEGPHRVACHGSVIEREGGGGDRTGGQSHRHISHRHGTRLRGVGRGRHAQAQESRRSRAGERCGIGDGYRHRITAGLRHRGRAGPAGGPGSQRGQRRPVHQVGGCFHQIVERGRVNPVEVQNQRIPAGSDLRWSGRTGRARRQARRVLHEE